MLDIAFEIGASFEYNAAHLQVFALFVEELSLGLSTASNPLLVRLHR